MCEYITELLKQKQKKNTAPYKQYTWKYSSPGIMGKSPKDGALVTRPFRQGGQVAVKGLAQTRLTGVLDAENIWQREVATGDL